MRELTSTQRDAMIRLIDRLRDRAEPIGPLHSFWDLIFDMEAFLRGDKTFLNESADEYISIAEGYLK